MPASASTPLADELIVTLVDDTNEVIRVNVADLQGLRGPPGTLDPDALPIAPDRAIAPGATTPIVPLGSFAYSTIAQVLVRFDGTRWVALGGGGSPPPDESTLVNDLGETLTNDVGEVLTYGTA